jgi:hypothetical protein
LAVPYGLILAAGKYLFVALLYGFLIWAFRGLFDQMQAERQEARRLALTPTPAPGVIAPAPVAPTPAPTSAPTSLPAPVPPAPVAAVPAPVAAPAPPALQVVAAPLAGARAALIVRDAGETGLHIGQVFDLTAAVTIGRLADNGIVVQDKFASSHHAMIFLQAGQRILRDRKSTNGTLHNGQRVEGDVRLSHGDRIGIGTVAFEYRAPAGQ